MFVIRQQLNVKLHIMTMTMTVLLMQTTDREKETDNLRMNMLGITYVTICKFDL